MQGIDRFRKSPPPPRPRRSAGTFSSTLYSSVARTECTLVTKVTRPPALLPSGHHWQQELPQPFPSGSCWPVGPSLLLLPPGLAPPGAPTQPRWLGPGPRGAQEGRRSRALPSPSSFSCHSWRQRARCHSTTSAPSHRPLLENLQPPTDLFLPTRKRWNCDARRCWKGAACMRKSVLAFPAGELHLLPGSGRRPKMEPCSSRHFVSATARFSYSCAEPSVRSSVLWKLPEKDITDVKGRQGEYILASTRARCFNRGYFGSSLDCPISLLGPLFSWSGCCPRFLVNGWPWRRWRPREALLLPQDNLTLLTMSWRFQLVCKTCDWWYPGEQLLLKNPTCIWCQVSYLQHEGKALRGLMQRSLMPVCSYKFSQLWPKAISISRVSFSLPPEILSACLPRVHGAGHCREAGLSLCASTALAEIITGRLLKIAGAWRGGSCPPADIHC